MIATILSLALALPATSVTPGAIDPAITQDNIDTTVCIAGYTSKVRPSARYTTALKIKQLNHGPYMSALAPNAFEEDHLISLELGGNPTDEHNLWPQPWVGPYNAHHKDRLENYLHKLVCGHKMTLKQAQFEISNNWIDAYKSYFETKK